MSNNPQVVATETVANLPQKQEKTSLVAKFAERFNVDGEKLFETLKATAFKQRNGQAPTNHQMMALMIVADQYKLNPFTKEIYAFPDQQNGIIPIVGVDGWSTIMNNHPKFDGIEFRFADTTVELKGLSKPVFEWIEAIVYRKDRERPIVVREYLDEIYRPPFEKNGRMIQGPWQTHTRRFARHKVTIQALRLALGYSGIYDEDEAERIIDAQARVVSTQPAIQFNSEPETSSTQAIESTSNVVEPDHLDGEFSVNTEDTEPTESTASQASDTDDDVFQTSFVPVPKKDAKMIAQMVQFTKQQGSWDTTKDSFKERYDGAILEFALNELNTAFNEVFSDE